MVLRKFIATFWLLTILAGGFIFGKMLVADYNKGYRQTPMQKRIMPETIPNGLWTPANEGEGEGEGELPLPLPEVDMKDSRELLPREIYVGQISYNMKATDHDGLQLEEHEIEIIKYTNEFRARYGKRPLKASRKLMGTSRLQAWHQTRRGMSHGYTRGWSGENIAAGQQSPREAVNAWINSSGHRANMLGNWNYIGVGGYNNQWAQQFE